MVMIAKGRNMQTMMAIAASIHQSAHVSVKTQSPQAGTQMKAVMLMIVASPMGNVPVEDVSEFYEDREGRDTQEEGLYRVTQHSDEQAPVQGVSYRGDQSERHEESNVQDVDDDREVVYPCRIIR